jgi:hypothetical protein
MKTAAGSRVLVVPTAMMELFRVAIEAFHTDPETGAVDPTARLVPGPLKADRSGQIAYRRAFDDAANDFACSLLANLAIDRSVRRPGPG